MVETVCPDGFGELEVPDDAMIGEIVSCPDCSLELEVEAIEGKKIKLQRLAIEKEDWGQ